MAIIGVTTSQNLTAVTYALGDTINVLDGVTLTINSQWSIQPTLIQALGTGRIEFSNASTTTPHLQQFYMQNNSNAGGFVVQQNGVLQVRGGWITVGTSTGVNNQTLFSSNSIGGVSIDYPSMIQVETGSGTDEWEVWQAIPEDVSGGSNNTYGFNSPNVTAGTVAVTTAGAVTGIGTNFLSSHIGLPFKLPSIARDFVISAVASTTSITIQELNGTTYTGGLIVAGATYIIRSGSLIAQAQVGGSDVGKVLFFNPLTTAVRMGDGTNGTKIPTGARVRVPNIHFNSALQQTTLATAITGTGAQAFTLAAQIGSTANGGINVNQAVGSLLLVSGSTFERIHYLTRAGAVVSATSQLRGQYGTTAQASFPIGTLVYWIPTPNTTLNNAGFSCNPSGTIDLQICSVGMRFRNDFSNYGTLTLNHFGCFVANIGSSAGAYDLDTLSILGASWQAPTAISATVTLNSMLGSGRILNVHANNNYSGNTSGTTYTIANIQNAIQIRNIRCRQWGRNGGVGVATAAFRCYLFTTIKCATPVEGLYMSGGGFVIAATTNIDIKDIFVASLPNANSTGSNDATIFTTIQSTVNSVFRGLQNWSGGIVSRGPLVSIDSSCESVVVHNKGYASIEGSLQAAAIVSDAGLNSILAFISVTNPRVIAAPQSYLFGNNITNSGGLFRMLLIDSVTSTAANTGGASKSGVELDMIAGPHRVFQTVAIASIIPNLIDIQPIVVLSNTAKTVGSVYVGSFSAQSIFNMYTFSGSAFLDNLGRIYYPAIGDSVIIKSVFALKGITNFTGTAFDFNYNLGSGTNPIPAGTTVEFRMVNWGTANTGAWSAFTNTADLETARSALTGYSSSVGLDLQLRITGTTAVASRYLMSMKLPVTIDAAYNPPVSETQVGISGAQTSTLLAGYLNLDPNNPELKGSLTMAGSFGSIPMPYDYDNTPVDYRLVARLQGWTFIDITGIYLKEDISIPITQSQVVDLSNTPLYTSGVTGVTVNHGASTVTLSANRTATQVWSAVQDNLCLLANLTQADPFSTTNGLSFISTYTLIVTGTLTAGNVIGNVTLSGALSSGVSITGNVAQATPTNLTGVTINGNLTFSTNTPITVTLTDCNVTGTISNSGSATVTITKVNTTIGTVGTNVIAQQFATISAPNLLTGTRVRILNTTNNVELFNGVLASAGFSQAFIYAANKNITLTATYTNGVTAKLGISANGLFTATGATFLNTQVDDVVYNTYGINGSLVTGFTADYAQTDVNLTMSTNFTAANLYAWWIYTLTTEDGIRNFFGGITALDVGNIQINSSIISIFLDNTTTSFIYQTDSIRLFRADNVYPAKTVTTGGGGISVNWNSNVYVANAESAEAIAGAVWDESMTTHNDSGSFGERTQKLLTLAKFIGLK